MTITNKSLWPLSDYTDIFFTDGHTEYKLTLRGDYTAVSNRVLEAGYLNTLRSFQLAGKIINDAERTQRFEQLMKGAA